MSAAKVSIAGERYATIRTIPPRRSGRDRRKDKDTPFTDYVI